MSQSTTTSTTTSSEGPAATAETNNNNNSGNNNQDLELPATTLEAAISKIGELEAKRDKLLADKTKTDKEIEKLNKRTRIETLKVWYQENSFLEREGTIALNNNAIRTA